MRNLARGVVLLLLVSGCAYNGMYHARRLTDAAEKAEREGRTIDAAAYWGQVSVKAETLLARHPDSKYAGEAEFLLGRAYAEMSDCRRADPILKRSLPALADSARARRGRLALATCQAQLGDHPAAAAMLSTLAGTGTVEEQARVRLALARSLRLAGRPEDAVVALAGGTGGAVASERILSLAAAGRTPEAVGIADSLAALRDTTVPWDSTLAAIGRRDPLAASALLDRIGELPGEQPETRASRLLADAHRLEAVDPARTERRLAEAVAGGADQGSASVARLALVRALITRVEHAAALDSFAGALAKDSANAVQRAEAGTLQALIGQARSADTISPLTPQGDMRVFLAAEVARDSLRSPRLAASLFRRIAGTWPESPYAPKALLAAELLAPADTGIRARLEALYPASPYVALLRGEDLPELRVLEDSLGAFALAASAQRIPSRGDTRPARDSTGVRRPAQQRPRQGEPSTTVDLR